MGNVSNIFFLSSSSSVFVGVFEKRTKLYFLNFDFRFASSFRFSFSDNMSVLL